MSDLAAHLETMRTRARGLDDQLDIVIAGVLEAEGAAREIGGADIGVPCELSVTDHGDLMYCLREALRALRGAERITLEHAGDIGLCQAKVQRGENLY